MFGRRLYYIVLLIGLAAYYIASGEWISWILLAVFALLPWVSLAVSLPAMVRFSLCPMGAEILEMGENTELWLLGSCDLPLPPFRGNIRLHSCFTGENLRYLPEKGFTALHCGLWHVRVERGRVSDYLGLFAFPIRRTEEKRLLVRPAPVPIENPPLPESDSAIGWKPKHGGGFAENHELRQYRPGDNLNQIHWKLSAKTGSLILREPMEPILKKKVLTLTLSGTSEVLDRKLGRLLWMGRFLLEKQLDYEIAALTGEGILTFSVSDEAGLLHAIDTLLGTPLAGDDQAMTRTADTCWQYDLGGEADAV